MKKKKKKSYRIVDDLSLDMYCKCVAASGKKHFKKWCKKHRVDYKDAISHDWG